MLVESQISWAMTKALARAKSQSALSQAKLDDVAKVLNNSVNRPYIEGVLSQGVALDANSAVALGCASILSVIASSGDLYGMYDALWEVACAAMLNAGADPQDAEAIVKILIEETRVDIASLVSERTEPS